MCVSICTYCTGTFGDHQIYKLETHERVKMDPFCTVIS